jgi:hypothetical protein
MTTEETLPDKDMEARIRFLEIEVQYLNSTINEMRNDMRKTSLSRQQELVNSRNWDQFRMGS